MWANCLPARLASWVFSFLSSESWVQIQSICNLLSQYDRISTHSSCGCWNSSSCGSWNFFRAIRTFPSDLLRWSWASLVVSFLFLENIQVVTLLQSYWVRKWFLDVGLLFRRRARNSRNCFLLLDAYKAVQILIFEWGHDRGHFPEFLLESAGRREEKLAFVFILNQLLWIFFDCILLTHYFFKWGIFVTEKGLLVLF
jgi:hypothetical protein